MEPIQILLTVMMGFSGLFALLIGHLIKVNQVVEIITLPGYSVDTIKDKATFSQFAGNCVKMIGFVALFTAVMIAFLPQFILAIVLLFSLVVTIICVGFMLASKKHFYRP
jgi:hypothetical protein